MVFPAPAIAFLLLTMLFPVAFTLYMSVQRWEFSALDPPTFIGLRNYADFLFNDARFWPSVARTFAFTLLAVAVETVLGVAIALIFNREFLGKGLIRTIFLFPMVATPVAIALVWATMFDPNLGVLNYFVEELGLPPVLWTSDADWVLPALALVDIWEWTPFITLITLAGLSSLPSEPYEAARIDGASPRQILWDLTLPMLRPTIVVAVLFRAIDALKTFDIIQVITQGGADFSSETLNIYAFQNAFNYYHLGYASAILVFFFMLVMGVSILLLRVRRAAE
ncbi:MAG: ABC transporter, permease protein 1 (cluster 1, maltose/g3p/polyamine/iron) [uncultured Thermomicrobiales bacterium]|uniref:ABC transporter, permease protein 1 (Cluster 1, maltose/g3p/polyamine/iron) n=1 Tax=uncultured Thermomicrobiales bacterium TaxID=1645740 RepID=A0A6J4UMJ8_9BACT|nr:MAG: ABC transporter, permease protein 1 (cluster 1, maltose/g3p/polyamine/iron) [uncultured Thermomicrobiales bacterium]